MPNNYFQFKQFTVHQEACAMKVCTDACIQGAYTARYLQRHPVLEVLDIGAGTGLLSLMLAQQLPDTHFTAIELDEAAAGQASRNFAGTPWAARMQLVQGDVRGLPSAQNYDFIIVNPPFYEGDLKSDDRQRNQAMHAVSLNYSELLTAIAGHLQPDGAFSVLLPYRQFAGFRSMAATQGFFPEEVLYVRQSVQHGHFRSVGVFTRRQVEPVISELAIMDNGNVYTPDFTELLQPYYLYL